MNLRSHSILVIEDDESLLSLFMKVLQRASYEVRSAGTLTQANGALISKEFDVVVCDLSVAGDLSIFDFVSTIQSRRPQTIVMVITGYSSEEVLARARSTELEVMEKPFTPVDLLNRITSLLAQRAA